MNETEGVLNPRIQVELENLNSATNDINKLEIELEVAHNNFKRFFSQSKNQLKEIFEKLGHGCIEKARCYYEAVEIARQAQMECHYQAHLFQKASEIHTAAKETVALAEVRFITHKHEWEFDQTWQEMLNHATIKVMNAENQKAECSAEHHRKALLFHDAKQKVQELEEKYRKSICKARPYFEVLSYWEQSLSTQKDKVECLQKAIKNAKQTYAKSFRALEEISNEIHQQRRDLNTMINGPREPGVGAELTNPAETFSEKNRNDMTISKTNDSDCNDIDSNSNIKSFQVDFQLGNKMGTITRSIDGSESILNQWEVELQASMEKLNNLTLLKNTFDINLYETGYSNNHLQLNPTSSNYSNKKKFDERESKKIGKDDELQKEILSNTEALTSNQSKSLEQIPIDCNIHLPKTAIKYVCSDSFNDRPINTSSSNHKLKTEFQESLSRLDNYEFATDMNSPDSDIVKKRNHVGYINNFLPYLKNSRLQTSKIVTLSNSLDNIHSLSNLQSKISIDKRLNEEEFLILLRFQSLNSLKLSKNKSYSMINLTKKQKFE